jgi:hypothetical protein
VGPRWPRENGGGGAAAAAVVQLRRQRRARGTLVSLVARATRTGTRAERASDSFFLSGNGSAGTCGVACIVI